MRRSLPFALISISINILRSIIVIAVIILKSSSLAYTIFRFGTMSFDSGLGDTPATAEPSELLSVQLEDLTSQVSAIWHDVEAIKAWIQGQLIMDGICPSAIDYAGQQGVLRSMRQKGIGEWFLETQEFKNWLNEDRAALLCSGLPGVGKTMITSLVVDHVLDGYKADHQIGVAYIYCQHDHHKVVLDEDPGYLMKMILRQFLECCETLPAEISNIAPADLRLLYSSKWQAKFPPSSDEISDLLAIVLSLFNKSFLIVDAIDELPWSARNEFVSQILAMQQEFNLNVLITSRHTSGIAQGIHSVTQVQIQAREEDLRCSAIRILERGYLLKERPDILERALSQTLKVADGILRLAIIYAKHLAGFRRMIDLLGVLDHPKNMLDPFHIDHTRAMQRLQEDDDSGDTKLGLLVIRWLCLAKRPLRLRELLHALATDGDVTTLSKDHIPLVSDVVDACAGLVVVDESNDSVGLFHETFREYLIKNQSHWFPAGDQTIGLMCVRYLSSDAFADGPCPEVDLTSLWSKCQAEDRTLAHRKRLDQFPLYQYASQNWYRHIRGTESENDEIVIRFLADDEKLSASCQTLDNLTPRTTGAHFAVQHSLSKALKAYLQLPKSRHNVKDNFGRRPLSYAAELNDITAADLLIAAGADPNSEDEKPVKGIERNIDAYTPLSYATRAGHLQMVKILFKQGPDVNHRDHRGRTLLSYAATCGAESVARLLLERGAEPNCQDFAHRTPLCHAAESGSCEVTMLLLDHGAYIDHADDNGATPLLLAARAESSAARPQHEKIISLLLAKGADVNVKSREQETPLSLAVQNKLVDSVRLLLQAGAKVNVWTNSLDPLSQASKHGPKELITLLLTAGDANLSLVNNRIKTPLALVALNGWSDTLQLLLEHGAKANDIDRKGRSVLSHAVESGSLECVDLLLKHGAEINHSNPATWYCEQLYYAMGMIAYNSGSRRAANAPMLEFLLNKGASPNKLDDVQRSVSVWESPLIYALDDLPAHDPSTERCIELLLDHGAQVDQVDKKGRSVLTCARHHSAGVKSLLRQYGAI
ncbi:hypothetical protein QM012_003349 [Aureobasidium pullulans]|uniref:Ankyrin n=1 Tax=Aureobasidium pullulans TaxID=5580 RepID=A0ABR0T8P9_AURPU